MKPISNHTLLTGFVAAMTLFGLGFATIRRRTPYHRGRVWVEFKLDEKVIFPRTIAKHRENYAN